MFREENRVLYRVVKIRKLMWVGEADLPKRLANGLVEFLLGLAPAGDTKIMFQILVFEEFLRHPRSQHVSKTVLY